MVARIVCTVKFLLALILSYSLLLTASASFFFMERSTPTPVAIKALCLATQGNAESTLSCYAVREYRNSPVLSPLTLPLSPTCHLTSKRLRDFEGVAKHCAKRIVCIFPVLTEFMPECEIMKLWNILGTYIWEALSIYFKASKPCP